MEGRSGPVVGRLDRMRGRLKVFWEQIKNHPIVIIFLFIWAYAKPLIVWLVDKAYGDEAYEAIRRAISGTRWMTAYEFLVAHWPEINATVFLSVLAFLIVQMWRESRTQLATTTRPKRASGRFEITRTAINVSEIHNIRGVKEIDDGMLRIDWTGEFVSRDEFLYADYEIMATQSHNCNIDVIEKTSKYAVISIRQRAAFPMEFVINVLGEESASHAMWSTVTTTSSMGRKGSMDFF